MKNFKIIFIIITLAFVGQIAAQDGYTYSLQSNGSYSFTIEAVPNASANNFATSVQSYGFTLVVPDGVTIDTVTATSLGGAANATFFNGTDVGMPAIDGYLITETLGAPIALPAPSAGTNSDIYTFTINGNPTSGLIYILENNSTLATNVTPLKSFMQADMIDNGMAEFTNVVDPNAAAVTAPSSFDLATLSVENFEVEETTVNIHPIPSNKIISIESNLKIDSYELFDISGKMVATDSINIDNQIDISKLSVGTYLIKLKLQYDKIITRYIIKK